MPFVEQARLHFLCKMKAPKLVYISSVLFSLLCIVQGVFLCIYPCKYLDDCWVFLFFIICFIAASFMALYLRFQKNIRLRFQWIDKKVPEWDIKSSLWSVWLVYSLGLMVTIAVIFNGVIEGNHEESCADKNGNFSGTFKDVKMCRMKDNEIFLKNGNICGSTTNETFCWKTKNKMIGLLKTDEFFGSNVLKTTLCATPVLMLLLLKSARAPKREDKKPKRSSRKPRKDRKRSQNETDEKQEEKQDKDQKDEPDDPIEDEDLKDLYFRATLNLFDGMEMLEELLEHGTHGIDIPRCLEIAILVCVCLFYCLSFLELLHLAFRCKEDKVKTEEITFNNTNDNEEEKRKKKWRRTHVINTLFQVALNFSFFILRMIMWLKYKRDAAIFIAKNVISIVMNVMPYLIIFGCVDDKNDDDDDDEPINKQ